MVIYVVDTSVVIERVVSKLVEKKEIEGRILIPRAVVSELENQANKGLEIGMMGLEELQNLQNLKKDGKIEIEFVGERPTSYQMKYAKPGGEIDALIRELAYNEDAVLITADRVQAESAKAFGMKVKFFEFKKPIKKLEIEKLFDDKTMSVHLKGDCIVVMKKGLPGNWKLVKGKEKYDNEKIKEMAKDIVEKTNMDKDSFVEISRRGSTIVQYKNYRIVITKPPVSDGWEITAVKPLKKLNLDEYKLPEAISERVKTKARGIIIAGETGSGKSTFAMAIAEDYLKQGRIVKTVESPRDLDLPDDITQYSKNFTSSEELHDILFLTRPDNLIFDEIRDTPDFKLYIDLRLAGSDCVGVMHSASPIDAIQRFIGRLDSGMIPSVLDTILFVEKGNVEKVYSLSIMVKVPSGMTESDLARPVVEVKNFEDGKLEYEIYSFGDSTVVIPVSKEKKATNKLAEKEIEREFSKYVDRINVEIVDSNRVKVFVPSGSVSRIIGKQGKNIEKIEKKLGVRIDVNELEGKEKIDYEVYEKGKYIIFNVNSEGNVDFYVDGEFLFSGIVSKKGEVKVSKKSDLGKNVLKALDKKKNVEVFSG
ncbi:ATPase [archaeon]|nr:ATPase [archaeon]|tara:strand:- start:2824 stop:4602 length:1779 start_codon:yes stop_codon:yes gene_type:complete